MSNNILVLFVVLLSSVLFVYCNNDVGTKLADQNLLNLISRQYTVQDFDYSVHSLYRVRDYFVQKHDQRGVFAIAYKKVTYTLTSKLGGSTFNKPQWVKNVIIAFLERYRYNLYNWELGRRDLVSGVWKVAFNASSLNLHPIADLLNGMIAHIVSDLPQALASSIDADPSNLQLKKLDYDNIGEILKDITWDIISEIDDNYQPFPFYLTIQLGAAASKSVLLDVFRNSAFEYAINKTYRAERDVDYEAAQLASFVTETFVAIKQAKRILCVDFILMIKDLFQRMYDFIKRFLWGGNLVQLEQARLNLFTNTFTKTTSDVETFKKLSAAKQARRHITDNKKLSMFDLC